MLKVDEHHNKKNLPLYGLVILRVLIGWHFLYEGIVKLYIPDWTSAGYLENSRWLFSGLFHWIAFSPDVLYFIDLLNIWGLILIGFCLILGCFTRIASVSGIFLLVLYYAADPPLPKFDFGALSEGHYLIVNKNLIELFSLFVLVLIPTGRFLGLDRFIFGPREKEFIKEDESKNYSEIVVKQPSMLDRREVIKSLATLPFLGAFTLALLKKRNWISYEEENLKKKVDVVSSASVKAFNYSSLKDLIGKIPTGNINGIPFSRMILGGNLIAGHAHARDLIYVSKLIRSYHTKDKIFETLMLAEKCGINAILMSYAWIDVINDYHERNIGKIKFIADCHGKSNELMDKLKYAIDMGAAAAYVQGAAADALVMQGQFDLIGEMVELSKQNGLITGIGAHKIDTVKACVEQGFEPDFWMKTFHHHNYWSAKHPKRKDNMYCEDPSGTAEFMKGRKEPWIAFKTLAAGAIHPEDGFRYAFENGADFICAGMYDFQLVDDINIALNILNENLQRERSWMA